MPFNNPHPLYSTWVKFKVRAKNKGIPVCKGWLVFANFVADMGERPDGCILLTKDEKLGYSKNNCAWVSESDKYKFKKNYVATVSHPLYTTWNSMIQRCTNKNAPRYKNYGGRGISICESWLNDFHSFAKDMGDKPKNTSIERIDNNGNYEPSNCRWATRKEQQSNRRVNRLITYNGVTRPLKHWADELGVKSDTIKERIENGYPLDIALFTKKLPANNSFTDRDRCSKGHLYDEKNTRYTKEGWRNCRTCHNEKMRARTLAKKTNLL